MGLTCSGAMANTPEGSKTLLDIARCMRDDLSKEKAADIDDLKILLFGTDYPEK
jgi:hypothetical protein